MNLSENEAYGFLESLFSGGLKDPVLIAELCPEGWENSPLFACYHPTPRVRYEESLERSLKMKATAASGTMQIVNKSQFSEVKTQIPPLEEQQKIGHYFRTLDELISKHALQLAKLKQLKSACLERMFV